ncbi:MAG: hypothetical protein GWP59_07245 [Chlamydiales bacterium]|nr:hypothetical protein [Chlamydiales bacterium]
MLGSYLVEKGRTRMFSHNIVFSEFSINAVLGTLLSSVSVKKQSIHGLKVLGKNLAIGAITVPVTAIAVKTLFPNRKLDLKLTAITHSIIGFYGVAHRPVPMLMGGADAVASNSGCGYEDGRYTDSIDVDPIDMSDSLYYSQGMGPSTGMPGAIVPAVLSSIYSRYISRLSQASLGELFFDELYKNYDATYLEDLEACFFRPLGNYLEVINHPEESDVLEELDSESKRTYTICKVATRALSLGIIAYKEYTKFSEILRENPNNLKAALLKYGASFMLDYGQFYLARRFSVSITNELNGFVNQRLSVENKINLNHTLVSEVNFSAANGTLAYLRERMTSY